MRLKSCIPLVGLALAVLAAPAVTSAQEAGGTPVRPAASLLVEFHGNDIPAGFEAAVTGLGGQVRGMFPEIGLAVVEGIDDATAEGVRGLDGVKQVVRDIEAQWIPQGRPGSASPIPLATTAAVNLPPQGAFFYDDFQWNLRQVHADAAWDAGYLGDSRVTVAVLDSGIDPTHIDMQGKVDLAHSVSFIPTEPFIDDLNFHGTFVAGIVSTNNIGVAGVAPHARLVAVKVLGESGFGSFSGIIAGIHYATNLKVDVINMSIVAYFPKSIPGFGFLVGMLAKAVNYAGTNGVLVVVSAGNLGINLDHDGNYIQVPAQSGNAMSVSATGPFNQANFDRLASYSNYGRSGAAVAAPGGEDGFLTGNFFDGIMSLCASAVCGDNNFYLFGGTGTSFAAPIVSGIAALVDSRNGGSLNGGQLRSIIERSADDLGKPGNDIVYSHGRVNALAAVTTEP